jgi:cytochrome c553
MLVKRLRKRRSVSFHKGIAALSGAIHMRLRAPNFLRCSIREIQECNMKSRLPILVSTLVLIASSTTAYAAESATTKGKAKAEAQCNVCHGANGMSQIPNAPHLAGQPEIYLIEQLKNYRSGKRANEVMAVLAKPLSDDDIANLAAWYASIEIKATPKP